MLIDTERLIDKVDIYVKAGDGGDGCVSFRREKFVAFGGPDGGDGGRGGDVIIKSTNSCKSLYSFKYKKHFKAEDGKPGRGKCMKGSDGESLVIYVPLGTQVVNRDSGEVIADLVEEGQSCVVACGGDGGKGNAYFKTSTNQAPRIAQKGKPGQERKISLEIKLLADVGIVGYPNVGKSTLLSRITAARPRIAEYPFTTRAPNLGELYIGEKSIIIVDIPGLIEGAHRGAGLGDKFLKHIERTKLLLHMLDAATGERVIKNFIMLNEELLLFKQEFSKIKQIVVLNKMDLNGAKQTLKILNDYLRKNGKEALGISAYTGFGLDKLIEKLKEELL